MEEVKELETEPTEEVEKDNNATETITEETVSEPERKFTQEELDKYTQKRLARQKKSLEKKYNSELSKYKELEYLTQKGLGTDNLDDTLQQSRDFYSKKGITYEESEDETDDDDLKILANADAREIIDSLASTEELEEEISNMEEEPLTERENLVLEKLKEELNSRQNIGSLQEIGADEKIYNSDNFKKFANKFNSSTPIQEIYEIYQKTSSARKESAGSMRTIKDSNDVKDFYTVEEARSFTKEDFDNNPELFRAVERSMTKW